MRPLKVYIAASWQNRFRLRETRKQLADLNIRVTSQGIDFDRGHGTGEGHSSQEDIQEANRGYHDIDVSDFVIIDTTDTATRGGREWEGGYATGRGKRVMRVGPVLTPFHARVNLGFESWDACLTYLATAMEHSDGRRN